jgi:hypothetical protein
MDESKMPRRWHELHDQVARLWSDVSHLTTRSRLLAAVASGFRSIHAIVLRVCSIGRGASFPDGNRPNDF